MQNSHMIFALIAPLNSILITFSIRMKAPVANRKKNSPNRSRQGLFFLQYSAGKEK
jgi:hypothetical protein